MRVAALAFVLLLGCKDDRTTDICRAVGYQWRAECHDVPVEETSCKKNLLGEGYDCKTHTYTETTCEHFCEAKP